MSKQIEMPLNELLNLGEGEMLSVFEANLVRENGNITVNAGIVKEFEFLILPFANDLQSVMAKALLFVDINKFAGDFNEHFTAIRFYFDENGLNIAVGFPLVNKELLETEGKAFYKDVELLSNNLLHLATTLTNQYAELKDAEALYEPTDFEFMYRKNNKDEWSYYTFARKSGRPIALQKEQIAKLMEHGIHELLFSTISDEKLKNKEQLHIRFISDGFAVADVESAVL